MVMFLRRDTEGMNPQTFRASRPGAVDMKPHLNRNLNKGLLSICKKGIPGSAKALGQDHAWWQLKQPTDPEPGLGLQGEWPVRKAEQSGVWSGGPSEAAARTVVRILAFALRRTEP